VVELTVADVMVEFVEEKDTEFLLRQDLTPVRMDMNLHLASGFVVHPASDRHYIADAQDKTREQRVEAERRSGQMETRHGVGEGHVMKS
jgi:hypothetical protein